MDSFLNLPSSPDPLADDVPSSARPVTRRLGKTLPQHDLLSLPIPQSTPRRSSPMRKSPRKQTFELDVGKPNSPQKILVTVEAEDALRQGIVGRRLFPSPSPSRGTRRRRTTTTTTVPLNDDATMLENDDATPRKRGRPRRTSNGTPMPRGRKRSGTPLQSASKQTRRKGGPASEASMLSDAPTDTGADGGEETPQVKKKVRKTPKKAAATPAVPSSQVSSKPTGRKRGRPRKAPLPEEVAVIAEDREEGNDAVPHSNTTEQEQLNGAELASEAMLEEQRGEVAHDEAYPDHNAPLDDFPPRESSGTSTPTYLDQHGEAGSIQRASGSPASAHQAYYAGEDDVAMSEDYPAMEAHSDIESISEDLEGVKPGGQDTLAHDSDFSMIGLDSLPSFQASFQANLSRVPSSPQAEMGEETNLIINQTLESLRRSTQTDAERESPDPLTSDDLPANQNRSELQDLSSGVIGGSSTRALSRSPRRPKSLPLSRQLFAAKVPHLDDSFSSLPDSVLQAATPGRLPMKSTPAADNNADDSMYDDSFSEIPEDILEAATPAPAARPTMPMDEMTSPAPPQGSGSANRNLGSSRLPTPDDTSSSTAGSKRAHEDGLVTDNEYQAVAHSNFHPDMPSSPPAISRPHAMDFGSSELHRELGVTPDRQSSPPQMPPSARGPSERAESLEPPAPGRRPTLSPIVRVGRTLQNVMSDRSSPDGRESSLGSPFRGSISTEQPQQPPPDQSRQSSMARSPAPADRNHGNLYKSRPSSDTNASFNQTLRSLRASFSNSQGAPSRDIIGQAEDPFSPAPPSGDGMSWAAEGNNPEQSTKRKFDDQSLHSRSSSIFATRGSNANQAMATQAQETAGGDELPDDKFDDLADYGDEEENGDLQGEGEDDDDLWDIEASRPSPRKPELRQVAPQPEPDVPAPRRNKIPSPWRRSGRRLIYQDEITSPTQIEIEEASLQSESEDNSLVPPVQRPSAPPPQAQEEHPEVEDNNQEPSAAAEQHDPSSLGEIHEEPGEPSDAEELDASPGSPEAEEAEEPEKPEEPEEPEEPGVGADGSDYSILVPPNEPVSQRTALDKASEPADASEYSMLSRKAKEAPPTQEKAAPAKSRFFGGFDILSFFSSPATLPQKKPEPAETSSKAPTIAQPVFQRSVPEDPPASLWSTGLFPSIPQKEFRPSPERRIDLFSPAPALRSNDTVADTYEPSTSAAPSPSVAPSTPERQVSPPIHQKRDFTPRPGQSRSSLFAPSRAGPSFTQSEDDDGLLQVPSDEHESSLTTEGSEYERLPPREKPSQWDRHLSPSKSCFRSPVKPKTPGRVVAFTGNALSPFVQMQTRNNKPTSTEDDVATQGPLFRSIREGKENQRTSSHNNRQNINANINTAGKQPAATALPVASERASASASASASATALSQTTWSKQHWIRLDEILQLRRRDPLRFQQQFPLPRRDQRRPSPILGKVVAAQGASIVIEAWHLEVVDAFRLEVGGWDERALAKRLFALVVGEERRRQGLVVSGDGERAGA
ncbi:Uu.00g072820.m01.CDS01 [Anthostomella pinea]|uniref:Uu.00g072820.m01.CDS01 n=1 Tax=Anthostomella pinea TaxID=933095 RepID=A0AAI8YLH5_9PEZI|nr:Uu.00g072820.m01.CDS01 [Anthostomella pinea]